MEKKNYNNPKKTNATIFEFDLTPENAIVKPYAI